MRIEITDFQDLNGKEIFPSIYIQDEIKKLSDQAYSKVLQQAKYITPISLNHIKTSLNGQVVIEKIRNVEIFN